MKKPFDEKKLYLVDGLVANDIYEMIVEFQNLAIQYLSDVEDEYDSDRLQEAIEVFDICIDNFVALKDFDALEIADLKQGSSLQEIMEDVGLKFSNKKNKNGKDGE
mgnify:CR=1 FL=1|tara:strand:+ start:695 stop:1012 length:318 start_codon:yes stop_codon:yes gene_type:complete